MRPPLPWPVRLFAFCLAVLFGAAWTAAARAELLQVTDPFVELRTGPGRGYPVFHVAARDEKIEVLLRSTDWYRVRTENGRQGWVHRQQLESTLTAAGTRKTFREVLLDDYLQRRLEFGGAWGRFSSEPMLKIWTAYRFADAFAVEATVGQVQGVYSGTDFWHLGLNAEPFADLRLSPYFGIGVGRFRNIPNASLVGVVTTDANLAEASAGLRYYLTRRFVARLDYTIYTAYVSDRRTGEFGAVTAGLSFFF
jgi:uncharacterized protein YgiM (DUF1202 family)